VVVVVVVAAADETEEKKKMHGERTVLAMIHLQLDDCCLRDSRQKSLLEKLDDTFRYGKDCRREI
jgi:hypothetical protein